MYSLRDLYPEVSNVLSTRESSIPEAEEQSLYGGIAEANGRVITTSDFWKTVGVLAALLVVLWVVGIVG